DGLIAYSTWLLSMNDAPRLAQLLDFVPASAGKRGAGFSVGEAFTGEVCYYPALFPVRAVIAERTASDAGGEWSAPRSDLAAQVAQAVGAEPWMQDIPVLTGAGRLGASGEALFFHEARTDRYWPVVQTEVKSAALGLDLTATAALMRHGRLLLLASQTSMGVLHHDE
ncbi:MAG: hypothetical protein MRY74_01480, partial [Neomegalonema sp.]|nr:hypothetical protein [Neomegalonema sp.]